MSAFDDVGRPLTGREAECLRWAAEGKTAGETGTITGLSIHTVRQYLAASRRKLGAASTAQACVLHDRTLRATSNRRNAS